jgi:glycosyltransferase involved in cell wall biosynthesis
MRVLFVSNSYPRDLRTYVTGSFQRMRMFVDAIKQIADLDLLFYVAPDVEISPAAIRLRESELSRYWDANIRLYFCQRYAGNGRPSKWDYYFAGTGTLFGQSGYAQTSQPEQVKAFESCLRLNPDIVFVHRLSAMCPLLLTKETLPPVLFDLDDVEHVYFVRSIEKQWPWSFKLLQYSRLPALLWGELRAIRRASRTFVCSEKDRSYLAGWWRLPGVVTIPNSTTIKKPLPVPSEPTLLFLGAFWYQPNVQAADFLIGEVWPHILRAVPSARLVMAGSWPEQITAYSAAPPGVEFPGFVDDLESLYRRSRVVCCPILRGGGTRIKIIEAAAFGKPIVATSVGAEGLDLRDGQELLLCDDAKSFADACIDLIANDGLCERLGSAAYDAAVSRYDRVKIEALIRSHVIAASNEDVASSPRPVDVPS